MNLSSSVQYLTGVGPILLKKLQKLKINTVEDLLFYFPSRYEDFSNVVDIANIKPNQQVTAQGKILEIKSQRTWKKRMSLTQAILQDQTAAIEVVWFNQPYLTKALKKGDIICVAGKAISGKNGFYLSNPAYEKLTSSDVPLLRHCEPPAMSLRATVGSEAISSSIVGRGIASSPLDRLGVPRNDNSEAPIHAGRLVPIYAETPGITSRWLRSVIHRLLGQLGSELKEALPEQIMKDNELMPLGQALRQIHFPDSLTLAQKARTRFSFEELFLIELAVLQQRYRLNQEKAPAILFQLELIQKFVKGLPFQLTDSQRKCAYQILKDLEKTCPMSRLLEGDVGSGKTVVAVMAALNVVKNGWQAAFMAPTEILAKQHFQSVASLLKPFKIKIALLTGKDDKIISQKLGHETKEGYVPDTLEISRAKILEKAKGKINPKTKQLEVGIDLLIGTHSLIQDKVKFGKLGLVVIDEQHRFGVEQRARLVQGSKPSTRGLSTELSRGPQAEGFKVQSLIPHLLSMTATPIPRTLALTIFGDLDLSLLDQMPQGRKRVITKIIPPAERPETYQFIRQQVKQGEQCFVVCPRIDPPSKNSQFSIPRPELGTKVSNFQSISNEKNEKILKQNKLGWTEAKAVKEEYKKLSEEIFPDLKVGMLHGKMKLKEKDKVMQAFKNKKIDILVSTSVIEVGVDIPQATIMLIEGAERFGLAQLHQFRGRVGRSDLQSYCLLFTDSPAKNTRQRLRAIVEAKNGFELAEKDLEIRGPGSLFGAKQWGIPDLAMEQLKHLPFVEKVREVAKETLQHSSQLKKYPLLAERLKRFTTRIHLE